MSERIAVCPGSFDPITNGHIDIIRRGLGVFDKVVVAVGHNALKQDLFTTEEKVEMIKECVAPSNGRISVDVFEGLLVDYVKKIGACAILRGLRVVSDFEWEMQLSLMNRKLYGEVDTYFLMTDFRNLFVSSTIIKATVSAGGSVRGLVPDPVLYKLKEKFPFMNTD
ncbi:MAG TPA: pantetheine-phosphate adenylyltransferase [Desulfomonilia bacterium]